MSNKLIVSLNLDAKLCNLTSGDLCPCRDVGKYHDRCTLFHVDLESDFSKNIWYGEGIRCKKCLETNTVGLPNGNQTD